MKAIIVCAALFVAGVGHAQGMPEQWRLVEELRIGSVDGPSALTGVHDLLVSPDGREVFVGQHRENLIRVFDAVSGRFVRTIGRRGQGPGEFNWMSTMGWVGDTLVVADAALHRMSLFSSDGRNLRTEKFSSQPIPGAGLAIPRAYLTNGTAVGLTSHDISSVLSGLIRTARWVQMDRSGNILRTLAERDVREAYGEFTVGKRGMVFGQPMAETVFLETAPNGSSVVVVHAEPTMDPNTRIRVTRLGVAGDTVYDTYYRYIPRSMPSSLIEETYRRFEEGFADVPQARLREAVRAAVKLPPALPPVAGITVGADGAVWLRRDNAGGEPGRWDLLGPSGSVRAIVSGPRDATIRAVVDSVVWATVADDMDVPYVVRYRIRPGPRSSP